MYTIGLIKERKQGEKRVLLNPETIKEFKKIGLRVLVESGAGERVGISDLDYIESGAEVCSRAHVWNNSNYIFKYKAPIDEEFKYFRNGLNIFAIFHAENNQKLVREMQKKGVNAYSLEFFKKNDDFCLAAAGSRMAGKVVANMAFYHLLYPQGIMGRIVCSDTNISGEIKALIIGSGKLAKSAAESFLDNGVEVTFLCSSTDSVEKCLNEFKNKKVKAYLNTDKTLSALVKSSDVVVGAILVSTYDTDVMISEEMVRSMKKGALLFDATAGYGSGYIETFDMTTSLEQPFFIKHGVLHFKIDNLPLSGFESCVSYANSIYREVFKECFEFLITNSELDEVAKSGLIVSQGLITHPVIKHHEQIMKWKENDHS